MSIATLEKAILAELKTVAKNPKLTKNNIMEWRCGNGGIEPREGETIYYLPVLKITCAVKIKKDFHA